ncbi:DUF2871 domain-containing protein [Clostridium carnis]
MKKLFNLSVVYLILGLAIGVFYREFTKFNEFEGVTVLGAVHSHTLVLGFLFFIIVLLLEKNFKLSNSKHFNKWVVFYNISLIYVIFALTARGIFQVTSKNFAGLSHIAGLGHAMLGVALIWFVVIVNKSLKLE